MPPLRRNSCSGMSEFPSISKLRYSCILSSNWQNLKRSLISCALKPPFHVLTASHRLMKRGSLRGLLPHLNVRVPWRHWSFFTVQRFVEIFFISIINDILTILTIIIVIFFFNFFKRLSLLTVTVWYEWTVAWFVLGFKSLVGKHQLLYVIIFHLP